MGRPLRAVICPSSSITGPSPPCGPTHLVSGNWQPAGWQGTMTRASMAASKSSTASKTATRDQSGT